MRKREKVKLTKEREDLLELATAVYGFNFFLFCTKLPCVDSSSLSADLPLFVCYLCSHHSSTMNVVELLKKIEERGVAIKAFGLWEWWYFVVV